MQSSRRHPKVKALNLPLSSTQGQRSARQIGIQQMMDQFNEQLSELDTRLRKGLSLGKDLKFEIKIRDSAHSLGRKASDH